jgi:hypothetical protein
MNVKHKYIFPVVHGLGNFFFLNVHNIVFPTFSWSLSYFVCAANSKAEVALLLYLTLIHSVRQPIGASGNSQNTQAANLLSPSKSCSFNYINGSKVAAQDST